MHARLGSPSIIFIYGRAVYETGVYVSFVLYIASSLLKIYGSKVQGQGGSLEFVG